MRAGITADAFMEALLNLIGDHYCTASSVFLGENVSTYATASIALTVFVHPFSTPRLTN